MNSNFFLAYVNPRVPMCFLKQIQPIRSSRLPSYTLTYGYLYKYTNKYIWLLYRLREGRPSGHKPCWKVSEILQKQSPNPVENVQILLRAKNVLFRKKIAWFLQFQHMAQDHTKVLLINAILILFTALVYV